MYTILYIFYEEKAKICRMLLSDLRSEARALGVNCRLLLAGLGRKERKGAKQTIFVLACSRLRVVRSAGI